MKQKSEVEISQILAAAAHDMRQPIYSLNLLLAALAGRVEDTDSAALVNSAQISADGVSGAIEAILSISAMRAAEAEPDMVKLDIAVLLDHCRDQFAGQAANKGLEFRVDSCALRVRSDRLLLPRLLDNLISNAVRHTDKGHVLVECRATKEMLRIGIFNSGPILDEQTLALFSSPKMSDTSLSLSPSAWRGFALGLSIAQEICALLGHTLSVSSEPGRGTAAWLEVGLAARSATTESSAEVAAPAPESEAMIALVEDDPDVYFATSELLIGWGYQVFGGASAEAAIEDCMANAGGRCPDLLLSDFKLPNAQTAIDVIMGFNRHFDSKIPTIVVSGDPSAALDVAVEGLEFEILQKPIRAEKMRALVRYALENSS